MNFYKIFTFLIILFSYQFLLAQAPDILWTRTYGGRDWDEGRSVQQTFDGGYIIAGHTDSYGAGPCDVWLIKTNNLGDTIWTKTYGGFDRDLGEFVQQTPDGGYIITGRTSSYGAGNWDGWLIKTDSLGDTLWTKSFGGPGSDRGYSVQQTSDDCYIITGFTDSYGAGCWDVLLIKANNSGDILWRKTYGESNYDYGVTVQETSDGGYIIVGFTMGYHTGFWDVLVIKTDNFGDTLWTKTYGGSEWDMGASVREISDGGFIIIGTTVSYSVGGGDIWLIKTDSLGDTLWTKTFGGFDDDSGGSVEETLDGGFIIAGTTESYGSGCSDVWIIKTDNSGEIIWTKTCGGLDDDNGVSVQQTSDEGYIITGNTFSYGSGGGDVLLIKIACQTPGKIQDKLSGIPPDFIFRQNYPNPFNPSTTIEFDLPRTSNVTLKIYNILGEEVVTLVSDRLTAGSYTYEWDASNMASGVYLYRLEAAEFIETRKLVLMR